MTRDDGATRGEHPETPAVRATHLGTPNSEPRADLAARDILWGLIHAHDRANANTRELAGVLASVRALAKLLVERGVLTEEEVDELRAREMEDVERYFGEQEMAVKYSDPGIDKYAFDGGPEIDCENRIRLCKAACCRLSVFLTRADVAEGVLRWEMADPYVLARARDGYCVHMNMGACQCTVYEQRPLTCRTYDCRQDKRIWLDFEARIPQPLLDDPTWPKGIEPPGDAAHPSREAGDENESEERRASM
jgi:hypothetical protein